MVTITRATAQPSPETDGIEAWLSALPGRTAGEVDLIRRACRFGERAHHGQTRATGEPYFHHALAVARVLVDLRLDHETIAAAILHDVIEDTDTTFDDLKHEF